MKKKVAILLLIFLLGIIIWKSNFLTIEKVNFSNFAGCVSNDQLNSEIKNIDKNSLFYNSEKFKNIIFNKYECVKDISISYEFPKTANVSIIGRKFFAKVYSVNTPLNFIDTESSTSSETALINWDFPGESSEDAFVVDETGVIFNKVKYDFPLPVIFLSDNIGFGTKLGNHNFSAIDQIFSKLLILPPISYQPNFKAKMFENTLLLNTSPKLAFSLNRDILRQLASLQLILQKAKIDERVAEFIDLRFDKPVVQYRTNPSK